MKVITIILVLTLGAIMGSFACCQTWRLRYRQQKKKSLGSRSVCLHCHHQLARYENIPIISWLILKGKCRHCGKKIGAMEILAELGMFAAYGLILWHFWGALWSGEVLPVLQMIALLILLVPLMILLLYDSKWGELPTVLLYLCIAIAAVYRALAGVSNVWSLLGGVAIFAGIYLLLYAASHEKLVGAGDWLLCLSLALVLGDWWLCLITLFLANALASLTMLPFAIKNKKHTIHFAPFLIIATLAVFLLQAPLFSLISF